MNSCNHLKTALVVWNNKSDSARLLSRNWDTLEAAYRKARKGKRGHARRRILSITGSQMTWLSSYARKLKLPISPNDWLPLK